MNDLLEAKLTITRIKEKLLDLAGGLIADNLTDKEYAAAKLLEIVEYIDEKDIKIGDIEVK
ncbi:hypothetical protein [Bacillus infantis]|uniref:hypothetical protein n=1 Tax=Bacillus infantis TaxID=324767 RepID=UPI003CF61132